MKRPKKRKPPVPPAPLPPPPDPLAAPREALRALLARAEATEFKARCEWEVSRGAVAACREALRLVLG